MPRKINLFVNTHTPETDQLVTIELGAGDQGKPVRVKAFKGARYQLADADTQIAPSNIRLKRVGRHLHLILEDQKEADFIVQNYYDSDMLEGKPKGVFGYSQDGKLYEYLAEDASLSPETIRLADGGTPVAKSLSGPALSDDFELSGLFLAPAAVGMGAGATTGAAAAAAAAVAGAAGGTGTSGGANTPAVTPPPPPGAPALLDSSDSGVKGDNRTSNTSPTIGGKAPAGAAVVVTVDGKSYTTTADADGNYSVAIPSTTPLKDGKYTPVVQVTSAGTTTTTNGFAFEVDSTTTGTGGLTHDVANDTGVSALDSITNNNKPAFSGTGEVGATVLVTVNGQQLSAVVDAKGQWHTAAYSGAGGAALADGIYPVTITFTDLSGNSSTVVADPIQIKATEGSSTTGGLANSSDSGLKGDNITNVTTPTIAGKTTPNSQIELILDDLSYFVKSDSNGNYSITVSASKPLADGQYTALINVVGNTADSGSMSYYGTTFTVDTSTTGTGGLTHDAANDTGVSATDSSTLNNKPTFSGTGEVGATVVVSVNGQQLTTLVGADGQWHTQAYSGAEGAALPAGTYPVTILFADVAGNSSVVTADPITIEAAPVISGDGSAETAGSSSSSSSSSQQANTPSDIGSLLYTALGEGLNLLGANMQLDLSNIVAAHPSLSTIDLSGSGANSITLTLADVLHTTMANGVHQLTLTGDTDDTIHLNMADWSDTGTIVTQGTHTYAVYNALSSLSEQLLIDQAMLNAYHVG